MLNFTDSVSLKQTNWGLGEYRDSCNIRNFQMTIVLEYVGLFQFGFGKLSILFIPVFVVLEMKGTLQCSKKTFLEFKRKLLLKSVNQY